MEERKLRNSNIELLKIIAILLIIIAHISDMFSSYHKVVDERFLNMFFFDKAFATTNAEYFIVNMFCYFGRIGNTIFFLATVYFLINRNKNRLSKIVNMILDCWIISLGFIGITILLGVTIPKNDFIYSLFPTFFANNYYVTVYIIFYAIFPLINKGIEKISQKNHLILSIVLMIVMSTAILFINSEESRLLLVLINLITFIIIYIFYSYLLKYKMDFINSKKKNIIILTIGIAGLIIQQLILNYVGLKVETINDKMLILNGNQNIFAILVGMGLFNIAVSKTEWNNTFINKVASLSLFIYVIHDNFLFRKYLRPWSARLLCDIFGEGLYIRKIIITTIVIAIASMVTAFVYKNTIGKLTKKVASLVEK